MNTLKVVKKANDLSLGAKVLRISIGGVGEGAYIVYRGDRHEIQALLNDVARAFSEWANTATEEPPVSPDDGKAYA